MADDDFGGFASPPFKAEDVLRQLQRSLRDLKLTERGPGFEWHGKRVLELRVDGEVIRARLARKLALSPEWDALVLKTNADSRKLLDEVKKRLARWDREA